MKIFWEVPDERIDIVIAESTWSVDGQRNRFARCFVLSLTASVGMEIESSVFSNIYILFILGYDPLYRVVRSLKSLLLHRLAMAGMEGMSRLFCIFGTMLNLISQVLKLDTSRQVNLCLRIWHQM